MGGPCRPAIVRSLFFFQAEDGIRDPLVTGVQTCALPISRRPPAPVDVRAFIVQLDQYFRAELAGAWQNQWLAAAAQPGSSASAECVPPTRSEERRVG